MFALHAPLSDRLDCLAPFTLVISVTIMVHTIPLARSACSAATPPPPPNTPQLRNLSSELCEFPA
ncbi:hypothetical protein EVJ58_g4288 [Rhodofomes roseus]|uniref:Uncharacterized protein n=1 Tax=Rhodofomes roseus TaxID=34475 RepID=A0A4Y9YHH8_9APHY|nr:hypothetical protein EVJ58_g4288 [Rhodofomes roseus]